MPGFDRVAQIQFHPAEDFVPVARRGRAVKFQTSGQLGRRQVCHIAAFSLSVPVCPGQLYGRASINLYAYNVNGNRGIAAGLNNLQKLADGDPLGGMASRPEDDFADLDDEEFEADDDDVIADMLI